MAHILFLLEGAGLEHPKLCHKGPWEGAIKSRLQIGQGGVGSRNLTARKARLPLLRRDGVSQPNISRRVFYRILIAKPNNLHLKYRPGYVQHVILPRIGILYIFSQVISSMPQFPHFETDIKVPTVSGSLEESSS